ncbi:uncharacterized protein LOC129762212 [Toxorhynchites rutilus septentrionalis]|uniref:uncharacterized protein LOC129762212 n=1 Tax=Toxorhynchites rutilus septentrionalis TaxID=329112 RepID=UPI002478AAD0|nr:uncharacterized protein LOC129762212 [Toxorhynchites rutilus septentrionalis]XP_055616237.1 uncharacterized protein LOC129762212 [Toxorhynchites rutilus septentrionalis]XP_055616238.1 uncharacterized protein LOC129762212 [Toxorhynchites rutilus septentrionalis]XP_055616239.1 uncharacterized protein LOC129762212 [Toxorhynchites rutilus septentrionalis]
MRILIILSIIPFTIFLSSATLQNSNAVHNSSFAKLKSKRNHGRTIERLIGGHVLFNHDVYRSIRNNFKNNNSLNAAVLGQGKNIQLKENNFIDDDIALITASAGDGNDQEATNGTKKDDSKKTLSDQVAEGKYGLIHKELFQTPPRRPGVLSYKSNSEVPKDDARNYGGLKDEEIWLSEDHLLVLKGGSVNQNNNRPVWRPIDDYEAPNRQVKLPLNPKIPPPFPVQLTDDGPVQFIGNNQLPVYNPFTNQTVFLFSNERVPDIQAENINKENTPAWHGKDDTTQKFNGIQYPPPAPIPLGRPNQTFSNPFLNLPPFPPSQGSFDQQNGTEIDEDDPSLYYPPPYSFVYKSNYSNPVSPGPLVPGIILPPPPNFFAPLEDGKQSLKTQMNPVSNKIKDSKPRSHPKNTTSSSPLVTTQRTRLSKVSTSLKPTNNRTVKIETPNYNIEIEKINVKAFDPRNETIVQNDVRPTSNQPEPLVANPTKKRPRPKNPTQVKKPTQEMNTPIAPPLISLNQHNAGGNPIYFEYFDARTPTLQFYDEYSLTTPLPFITTIADVDPYTTTTIRPHIDKPTNKNRPPSKTYLPSKNKDVPYVDPDIDNYRYKSMQEFDREIETIRQTLRFYENSVSLISNLRTPKKRPVYDVGYDANQARPPGPLPHTQLPLPVNHIPLNYNQPTQPSPDINGNYRSTTPAFQQQYYVSPPVTPQNINPFRGTPLLYNNKPGRYNNHDNTNPVQNTHITNADYLSVTTGRPYYYDQPNWYTIEKVKLQEIPKPLIYNNGASGYNQKLYLPSKFPVQDNSGYDRANINPIKRPYENKNPHSPATSVKQNIKYVLRNSQQANDPYLERDVLINYKHPLPAINPDSEILPYNGRNPKPLIQYQLPGDKAHVYFLAPHDLKYKK